MTNAVSDDALAAALTDVRRAYRLLWGFHKRVLEYNRIIRTSLGFEHLGAKYRFGKPGQNPEARYAWDLCPGAQFGLASIRRSDAAEPGRDGTSFPRAGDAVLYVRVKGDTGLADFARPGVEPDPVQFPPPEESQTLMEVYVLVNREERSVRLDWLDVVLPSVTQWPAPGQTGPHPAHKGIDIYGDVFDLARLGGEDALLLKIDAFKAAASRALGLTFGTPQA
ncbi:hypothetical protein [Azospirillum soli]|uniref:hypothetical protein n=1 Tax=Azospirillum soli TaxID=1304799 RepID=UPI001AE8EAA7|nr:hypothetical protein [Azospirillum soli]MBP2316808.1 hypothetical protein [Azospirillum soli]